MVGLQKCMIQIWFIFSVVIVTLSLGLTRSSRTSHQCVDHDTNCPLYKNLMCTSNEQKTKTFAIKNCPVTCNYCNEYLAQFRTTEVFSCFGSSCTTPEVCHVYFKNNVPVSGSCVGVQKNSQICGPFPTNGTCDCYSGKCMSVIDMLYSIHNTTVPWKECVDHDSRCQVMKSQICSANAPEHTKKFAIKTCPSACNYCRQYSELLHPTPKIFSCFSASCTTLQVCRVNFVNRIPISASCMQKQQKIHICSFFPTNGYCDCDSAVCMSTIITYLLASIQVGNQATQVQSTTPTTTHMITTSVITTHVETATPTTTHVPTTTPTTTHEPTTTPTTTHEPTTTPTTTHEPTTSPTTTHEPTTSPTTTHEPTTSPTTTNLQTTTPTTTHMISTTPTTPVAFLSSSVSASQNVNTQGPPCEDKPEVDCTLFVSSNICNVPTAKIYCAKTCTHCMPVDVVNGHLVG